MFGSPIWLSNDLKNTQNKRYCGHSAVKCSTPEPHPLCGRSADRDYVAGIITDKEQTSKQPLDVNSYPSERGLCVTF